MNGNNFKNKIKKDVENQFKENEGSEAFLNNNKKFNHDLRLEDPKTESLFKEIMKDENVYNQPQKLKDLQILVGNLIKRKNKPTAVSLSVNTYIKNRYTKASPFVIQLIKKLQEKNYIKMQKGYHTQSESKLSRIWATEKLIDYLQKLPNSVIYEPSELVELRDEKGQLKDYKDTAKTRHIRKKLEHANKVNAQADIRYKNYRLNPSLIAIFKQKFTLYGRLHTRGYKHYQSFSGNERQEITINGEPVVELDYSALHPYLLYAKEGIQYFGDPYAVIEKNPIARNFLKNVFLYLLNSKDILSAERAGNNYLYRNHKEREALKAIGITRARPIIEGFKENHKPISHYFASGKESGLRTMNKDAAIALDVLNHFVKQNIPILTVHDSFLVQKKYKDELRKIMAQTYRKHTKGFRIKIKVE